MSVLHRNKSEEQMHQTKGFTHLVDYTESDQQIKKWLTMRNDLQSPMRNLEDNPYRDHGDDVPTPATVQYYVYNRTRKRYKVDYRPHRFLGGGVWEAKGYRTWEAAFQVIKNLRNSVWSGDEWAIVKYVQQPILVDTLDWVAPSRYCLNEKDFIKHLTKKLYKTGKVIQSENQFKEKAKENQRTAYFLRPSWFTKELEEEYYEWMEKLGVEDGMDKGLNKAVNAYVQRVKDSDPMPEHRDQHTS
mgnify:CR=1 FL=1